MRLLRFLHTASSVICPAFVIYFGGLLHLTRLNTHPRFLFLRRHWRCANPGVILCPVENLKRGKTPAYVHSRFPVSVAARSHGAAAGARGQRDSRLAGADSGIGGNQLQQEYFASLVCFHTRRRDEVQGCRFAACLRDASGAQEAGGLANAAAEGGCRTGL